MKKLLLFALLLASGGIAQTIVSPTLIYVAAAPTGACTNGYAAVTRSTGVFTVCLNGTWGSPSFAGPVAIGTTTIDPIQGEFSTGLWTHTAPIAVTNSTGSTLTQHQVKITLDATFEWDKATSTGADVRILDSTGALLPYWIESWTPNTSATIYTKVPTIPTTGATIYLYYGNPEAVSAANGNNVFEFFDDFSTGARTPGFWAMSAPTTFLTDAQGWEGSQPHTMSVVDWGVGGLGGFRYWGYYGLQSQTIALTEIGLARSNDLTTWTKYVSNPILGVGSRWPYCVLVGSTVYMAYTLYSGSNVTVKLASSTDGLAFSDVKDLVATSTANKSQFLWQDPLTSKYWLYYFIANGSAFEIHSRGPSTLITSLDTATDTLLMTSQSTLAAPAMFEYNGTYYFSVEFTTAAGIWETSMYYSAGPTGPFTLVANAQPFEDGAACLSLQQFGTTLYAYNCVNKAGVWSITYRTQALSTPRPMYPQLDTTKWPASSGGTTWIDRMVATPARTGYALKFNAGSNNATYLQSSYTGTDYIWEITGELDPTGAHDWGLAVRSANVNSTYAVLLYDNHNGSNNVYLYKKVPGIVEVGHGASADVFDSTWYTMTVAVHGSTFNIYRDGTAVSMTVSTDATYASGYAGLYIEGSAAHFSNARIRKWATSDPVATVGFPTR